MLKTIIVDDEKNAIESLKWELSKFSNDLEVVTTFTSPTKSLNFLNNNNVDCVFLDIEMQTMDGFQFIKKLSKPHIDIVFTTAYNNYGIKAIKNDVTDYLLKPVDSSDLEKTIKKIKKKYITKINYGQENFNKNLLKENQKREWVKIKIFTDGKLIFLDKHEILFIESDGNYCSIFLCSGKKIVLTKKLKDFSCLLPDEFFFRIHNSYIINLSKIREYYKANNYVVLEGNHKVPVSRQKKTDFLGKF